MKHILHIAIKDLRLLWRDKGGLFFILVFPLVYATFFSLIFGSQSIGKTPMRIAVIDLADTEASRDLIERLQSSSAVAVEVFEGSTGVEAARDLVRLGKKVAYLNITAGYGQSARGMGLPEGEVELGIDPARHTESAWLKGILTAARYGPLRDSFGDSMGFNAPWLSHVSVVRDTSGRPTSPQAITFPSAMLWGLLGCAAGFAISLVKERAEGTLVRLTVAPIGRAQIMGGKALACFMACLFVMTVLILFAVLVFGMGIGSLPMLALGMLCNAAAFTGIMILVSALGQTEAAVSGAAWAFFVVMAMIGGAMVPLIAMPEWLFNLSSISPVKWGILALEGAIWRDFNLREMAFPCAVLLGTGAVCFALSIPRLRRA